MSWLFVALVGLAEAAEYRHLELADGRALAVEVLETGPDGLRVRVPAGVMRLPFEDILTIEPATEREWMTQPPQRVLLLPTMADPRMPSADAVALDEVLRGTLAGMTGVRTFRLAELPAPESLRAALGGCGADAACVQSVLPKAGVDLALLPGLDSGGATVEVRFAKAPAAGRRLTEPFGGDAGERVAAARALVDDALGLEPAQVATAPSTPTAVTLPGSGTVATAPVASPPATVGSPAGPTGAGASSTASAAGGGATAATSAGSAASAGSPATSPGTPTAAGPSTVTSSAPPTGPTVAVAPAGPSVAVSPVPGAVPSPGPRRPLALPSKADLALSFVPVPGFPAWVRGDTKRGAFATLAALPTTAALVVVEGAAGARKGEVLAVSALGYYTSCVVYSRAFLPIVRPVEGGAAVSAVGRF